MKRERKQKKGQEDTAGVLQEAESQDGKEGKKRSAVKEIMSYVWAMAAAFIAATLISHFVLINAVIPSESMENLLHKKDRLFGCRLSYVLEEPKRYDVVMFKYPVDEETIYIKRVIGLPGETVEIKKGKIYIDHAKEPIEEDYLPEKWVDRNTGYTFEVPDGCYLMLGDNRNISEDARDWAQCALDAGVTTDKKEAKNYTFVHKDKIIARAILKYYPKLHLFLDV